MGSRKLATNKPKGPDRIELVGAKKLLFRDLYHTLIQTSWPIGIALICGTFFALNLLFAIVYFLIGGIANAHSFADYFFFSVQTSGTIGYGSAFPTTIFANLVVTLEAIVSILFVALTTGLVFARFSLPRARLQFAASPVISLYDGVPTLMFRLGNERASRIMEAVVRVVAMRSERTKEGVRMYRMYDLKLERERSPALTRSWTVLHHMDKASLLYNATPESLAKDEIEIIVTVIGTDERSAQSLHAQHHYSHDQIQWGARHADLLTELDDGGLRVDLTKFHETIVTVRTTEFPYGDQTVDYGSGV